MPRSLRQRPRVESLEARILYSADPASAVFDAMPGVPVVERRVIDAPAPQARVAPTTSDSTPAETRHELVLVDTRVANWQELVGDIQRAHGSAAEIVMLDPTRDGIEQISERLAQEQGLDAVHIISHGEVGALQIGATRLDFDTLLADASAISRWRLALNNDADLLLYGCDLAASSDGRSLVDALSRLTGADVAASTNLTGGTSVGGDWTLEYTTGRIQSEALANASDLAAWNESLGLTATGSSDTIVNTVTGGTQLTQSAGYPPRVVAMDGSGNFVVVWNDPANSGDVCFRRFDAAGAGQGAQTTVNTSTSGTQDRVSVAMNSSGAFVVVWDSGADIYAQRYNASGVAQGGNFVVNKTTSGTQSDPSVAMDDSGNFIVSWTGTDAGGDDGIFARRFNASGVALDSSDIGVNATTSGDQKHSSVTCNDSGNFVVAWDGAGTGDSQGIYLRMFNGAGVAQGSSDIQVNTTASNTQDMPTVSMNATGQFVVSWESQDSSGYGAYARAFNASGVAQTGEVALNAYTNSDQDFPVIAIDSQGNFLATWESNGQDGNSWGVYSRMFSKDGVALASNDTRINATTANTQEFPSVAWNGSQAVYVWDGNGPGDSTGIFFRTFTATAPGITVSGISGNTTEAGGTASFTVALTSAPTADVTISIASNDASEGTTSTSTLTFTTANWNVAQVVTVTGVNDAVDDGDIAYSIVTGAASSADASYNGMAVGDVAVTNVDNDTAGVSVSAISGNTTEAGGTATFSVVLTSQPATTVTIPIASSDPTEGMASTSSLTFTTANWNVAQIVTVTGVDDALDDGNVAYSIVTGAATSVDSGETRVNLSTTGTQTLVQTRREVGIDSNGNYAVVWASTPDGSANSADIFVRLYAADGTPRSGEIAVNTTTAGAQIVPSISMDAGGNFVVVWQGQDGSNYGVFAQRFASDGSKLGTEFQVNQTAAGLQQSPSLGMAADGSFVVTWESDGQDGSNLGVYARRYAANGTALGNEFRVNTYTTLDQYNSSVAVHADGHFVITWESLNQEGNGKDIFMQRYDASGVAQGSETRVNTVNAGTQELASIAMDASGNYIIVWSDGQADGSGRGIYGQRFNASGVAQGSQFRVNVVTTNDQTSASVAMNADGSFAVSWQSWSQDGDTDGVYLRQYAANGMAVTGEVLVNSTTTGSQAFPSVAVNGSQTVVAWAGAGAGDSYGVFFRRFDSSYNGMTVGDVAVTNVDDDTGVPTITGTATEDQVLTVNTAGITDTNGGAFSYQWLRNGVAIGGATASTYTLGDADVGRSISVRVSYTNGQGGAESPTSAAVGPVANINDVPSGVPTISGTATEDQQLTAVTSGIADADGLGSFSYQWLRSGVAISGATASSYTLADADVGTQIRVRVNYTDGNGTAESLTSAATGTVANVNDAPTGLPAVTGTATEDQVLTANTSAIGDADGLGAFAYQWLRNGATIAGATASTYTLDDADVGQTISVRVNYTDGRGTAESLTSAAVGPVGNVNDLPTGAPTISGTATEDQVLTAVTSGIGDADGLGSFSYQWLRNGTSIAGATASTYTLRDADVGQQVQVRVSYTDGHGTPESVTSAATATVANVNDAPAGAPVITGTPTRLQTLTANTAAVTDADGLGAFSYQWLRNGVSIGGATGGTYVLDSADVGQTISVRVNYTDGHGTAESLTSAAVGPVSGFNNPTTGAPVINGTPTEDQLLTADTSGIGDADGLGAFSYQWLRDGAAIGGATGSTYALGDADVGTQISVRVGYTDGQGTAESMDSAAVGPVANVNDAPTGLPAITGTTTEDQVLSVDTSAIADADGLGAFSYQWLRNGVTIAGATGTSYLLVDADVGVQIGVRASYVDGHGTAQALDSATAGPVANVNDAPVGLPTISGIATEDQQLTAVTSGIADDDGLGAFGYQWLRNGVAIGGATASTYTLGDADVGRSISVRVSYTDAHGTAESLTSATTGPVANVNDVPTGLPTISGSATEDQQLTAVTSGIADADGLGAFSYQWLRNGVAIGGATAGTYLLDDTDVGQSISVRVGYVDGNGTAESLTSAAVGPVANVNDAPAGLPTIGGTATEDQQLTADTSAISDADGLGAFSYQWLRNGVAIGGATANTHTLGDADVGQSISVRVSYTDGEGTVESLTSAAVDPVANVNDLPAGAPMISGTATEDQQLTADTSAIADADGLGAFSYQWLRNGGAIGGATAATYTLGDTDVDQSISVRVSYTDGHGTVESLTSAAVGPVANVNDAPAGLPIISGTATEDQQLTADTSGIVDGDDLGMFSYQWLRNGVAIVGAASDTYTLGDADVGQAISVSVSYVDGHGTAESTTSATVGPVANVNDTPAGLPAIVGTAAEDQQLTADTSSIADADGLGAFSYQWLRDGVAIAGATGTNYLLGDADVGAQISVRVSYADGHGTAESLDSATAGPVANVNDVPAGAPTVSGTAAEDQQLTADTSAITDADGLGAFGYQWLSNGVAVVGATGSTYALSDADVGQAISVRISYVDGNGTAESLTSATVGPVANVNDTPMGLPMVGGTAAEDQQLTADTSAITDADGPGAFSYQWLRDGVVVVGATASTYTPGDADVGQTISVSVSYVDGQGTAESVTSATIGPVTNVNDAPAGLPTISGAATEDQQLSADTSAITDADGLGAFNYQWLRNGVAIVGATTGTYTLGDADIGHAISVQVGYTDGNGTAESLTSATVGPVANVNDAPTGLPTISGTATEGQQLTADTSAIGDADGLGAFGYEWLRNGATIGGATAGTYTLSDADVGQAISVSVSYVDGHGTAESMTSATVGPVANVNDTPAGLPTIGGTVTEDQQLTADTSGIVDADGLGAFSYQWLRNGATIAGATGGTYTLGDADVGQAISVQVGYTDGNGTAESLTSATVGPVANVNDAPSGLPTISGSAAEDQQLTASTSSIGDADGLGTFSYQWLRNGAAIAGATSSTYTLADADVGQAINVQVGYTDGNGTAESLTSTTVGPVANVDDTPTGLPAIVGTAVEDQLLTADTSAISDADGLGPFGYQWLRNGVAIGGATAGTYLLGDADVGQSISVRVSYTDGHGAAESLASAAVGPVANVNDAPTGLPTIGGAAVEDQPLTADTSGIADADGLGGYSYQWLRNGASISGATTATYTLGDADVGQSVSVRVSYTDAHGTSEALTSSAVGPVVNVNDAPTGAPAIDGTPARAETLIANTSGIADADGLGSFSYQWLRDGAIIGGATAVSYTLGDADVGAQISVRVSYVDGAGITETLASVAVGPVANVERAPVLVLPGSLEVDEDASLRLGDVGMGVSDADGNLTRIDLAVTQGGLTVDLSGGASLVAASAGNRSISLVGTQAQLIDALARVTYSGDADWFGTDALSISATDASGLKTSGSVAIQVSPVNDAPVITSASHVDIPEGQVLVTQVTSTDVEADARHYAIVGGADAAQFVIDGSNGELRLRDAPDAESPADSNRDNVYEVTVEVVDSQGGAARQNLDVTVLGVNEAPTVAVANLSVPLGGAVTLNASEIVAHDVDSPVATLTFSVSGVVNGHFELTTQPGTPITSFSASALDAGLVSFVDDAGTRAPQFAITVSDGQASSAPVLVQLAVSTGQSAPPAAPHIGTPAAASPQQDKPAPTPVEAAQPPAVLTTGETPSASRIGTHEVPTASALIDESSVDPDLRLPARAFAFPLPTVASHADEADGIFWHGNDPRRAMLLAMQDDDARGARDMEAADTPRLGLAPPATPEEEAAHLELGTVVLQTLGIALTAGSVWWALRAAGLVTALLASLPAWRQLDFLPVLAEEEEDDDRPRWSPAEDAEAARDEAAVERDLFAEGVVR